MNDSLAIYENFPQTRDIANALAASDLVPPHFQKKPSNVLIALEFAHRNNIAPFAAMQSMFVVHGRVGMSASMAISLARKHNVWKKMTYKTTGSGPSLAVTAVATLHDDSEASATVTMGMANEAGWSKNAVYKSIPEQMLKYRAATFLIRSHFPEVLFGMQTTEEIEDVHAAKTIKLDPKTVIDVKPSIPEPKQDEPVQIEEPVAKLVEPETIEAQSDEFSELLGGIHEFIDTRPSDWFSKLGKLKDNILSVTKTSKTIRELKSIESTLVKLDEKYAAMQGGS